MFDRMATWERRWADADYDWVDGYRDDCDEEAEKEMSSYEYVADSIEFYQKAYGVNPIEKLTTEEFVSWLYPNRLDSPPYDKDDIRRAVEEIWEMY